MAAGLPDDLVLEYDLLQLVDGEEGAAGGSGFLDPPSCPNAFNVDDLLGNCSVGVDIASEAAGARGPDGLSKEECELLSALDDKRGSLHEPGANPAPPEDDVSAFIVDGEAFLREMEKVVKLDGGGGKELAGKPCTCYCPEGHCVCGAVDLDGFTDVDVLSSPCPSSTCPNSSETASPCKSDLGEIEIDCPILKDRQAHAAWIAAAAAAHPSGYPQMTPPAHPVLFTHQSSSSLSTASTATSTHSLTGSPIDLTTDDSSADSEDMDASNDEFDSKDNTMHELDCVDEDEEMTEEEVQHDKELLEKEATYLEAQHDYLVSRAKSSRPQRASIKSKRRGREPAAVTESKQKLADATQEKSMLSEIVSQQKTYMDNFKAMLSFAPVNDVRMALMTPIESYIHLGKDFDERRKTILSLREEKLDMTYKYIEQKSQGLNLDQPYHYSDTFEKFGKQYCVNFAISKYEGVSVFQVARAIYEQIAGKDEEGLCAAMGTMTIRESYDSIRCNFMHQRIISSMKWDEEDEKMPELESNALFFSRFGDNSAVMATDYIDQDDLHPYQTSTRMRKDVSSGVVLTGHEDANGNKYVVMKRFLMAKYHMYPHKFTPEQQERLFSRLPMCHETMKSLLVDKIARGDDSGCGGCEQAKQVAVQQ